MFLVSGPLGMHIKRNSCARKIITIIYGQLREKNDAEKQLLSLAECVFYFFDKINTN